MINILYSEQFKPSCHEATLDYRPISAMLGYEATQQPNAAQKPIVIFGIANSGKAKLS